MDATFQWLRLDERARSFRACEAFARAAGGETALRARAERLHGTTLYVRVSSSAWAHQLHLLKEELLTKLRREPDGAEVRELRFSVGPLTELPSWEAASPSLPARRQPACRRDPAAEGALEAIADPELRGQLKRLYRAMTEPPL